MADLTSNRPEALQPERPKADEARIVGESPLWAEFDVALRCWSLAHLYELQSNWRLAAETDDQAVNYYKDLVEHSPSVGTFTIVLEDVFEDRCNVAELANDRKRAAAYAQDAVAFWNRLMDLHPDVPGVKQSAEAGCGI